MAITFNIKSNAFSQLGKVIDSAKLHADFNISNLSTTNDAEARRSYIYTYAMLNNVKTFSQPDFDKNYYETIKATDPFAAANYIGYKAMGNKSQEFDDYWNQAKSHYEGEYTRKTSSGWDKFVSGVGNFVMLTWMTELNILDRWIDGMAIAAYDLGNFFKNPVQAVTGQSSTQKMARAQYNKQLDNDEWIRWALGDKTIAEKSTETKIDAYYSSGWYNDINDAVDGPTDFLRGGDFSLGDAIELGLGIGESITLAVGLNAIPVVGPGIYWSNVALSSISDSRNADTALQTYALAAAKFGIEYLSEQIFVDSIFKSGWLKPDKLYSSFAGKPIAYIAGKIGTEMATNAIEEMVAEGANIILDWAVYKASGDDDLNGTLTTSDWMETYERIVGAGISGALVGMMGAGRSVAQGISQASSYEMNGKKVSRAQDYTMRDFIGKMLEGVDGDASSREVIDRLRAEGMSDEQIKQTDEYKKAYMADLKNQSTFIKGMSSIQGTFAKMGYDSLKVENINKDTYEIFSKMKTMLIAYDENRSSVIDEKATKNTNILTKHRQLAEALNKGFEGTPFNFSVLESNLTNRDLNTLSANTGFDNIVVVKVGSDGTRFKDKAFVRGNTLYVASDYYYANFGSRSTIIRDFVQAKMINNLANSLGQVSNYDFYNQLGNLFDEAKGAYGSYFFIGLVEKHGLETAREMVVKALFANPKLLQSLYVSQPASFEKLLESQIKVSSELQTIMKNNKDFEAKAAYVNLQMQLFNATSDAVMTHLSSYDTKLAQQVRTLIADTKIDDKASVLLQVMNAHRDAILNNATTYSAAIIRALGFSEVLRKGDAEVEAIHQEVIDYINSIGKMGFIAKNNLTILEKAGNNIEVSELANIIMSDLQLQNYLAKNVKGFNERFIMGLRSLLMNSEIKDKGPALATLSNYIKFTYALAPANIKEAMAKMMVGIRTSLQRQNVLVMGDETIAQQAEIMTSDPDFEKQVSFALNWVNPVITDGKKATKMYKTIFPSLLKDATTLNDVYTILFGNDKQNSEIHDRILAEVDSGNGVYDPSTGTLRISINSVLNALGIIKDTLDKNLNNNALVFIKALTGLDITQESIIKNAEVVFSLTALSNANIHRALSKASGYVISRNVFTNEMTTYQLTEMGQFFTFDLEKTSNEVKEANPDNKDLELSDSNLYVSKMAKTTELGDIFDIDGYVATLDVAGNKKPAIKAALKQNKIIIEHSKKPGMGDDVRGYFNPNADYITLIVNQRTMNSTNMLDILVHEVTHAIANAITPDKAISGALLFSSLRSAERGANDYTWGIFNVLGNLMGDTANFDFDALIKGNKRELNTVFKYLKLAGLSLTESDMKVLGQLVRLSATFLKEYRSKVGSISDTEKMLRYVYAANLSEIVARRATDSKLIDYLAPELFKSTGFIQLINAIESVMTKMPRALKGKPYEGTRFAFVDGNKIPELGFIDITGEQLEEGAKLRFALANDPIFSADDNYYKDDWFFHGTITEGIYNRFSVDAAKRGGGGFYFALNKFIAGDYAYGRFAHGDGGEVFQVKLYAKKPIIVTADISGQSRYDLIDMLIRYDIDTRDGIFSARGLNPESYYPLTSEKAEILWKDVVSSYIPIIDKDGRVGNRGKSFVQNVRAVVIDNMGRYGYDLYAGPYHGYDEGNQLEYVVHDPDQIGFLSTFEQLQFRNANNPKFTDDSKNKLKGVEVYAPKKETGLSTIIKAKYKKPDNFTFVGNSSLASNIDDIEKPKFKLYAENPLVIDGDRPQSFPNKNKTSWDVLLDKTEDRLGDVLRKQKPLDIDGLSKEEIAEKIVEAYFDILPRGLNTPNPFLRDNSDTDIRERAVRNLSINYFGDLDFSVLDTTKVMTSYAKIIQYANKVYQFLIGKGYSPESATIRMDEYMYSFDNTDLSKHTSDSITSTIREVIRLTTWDIYRFASFGGDRDFFKQIKDELLYPFPASMYKVSMYDDSAFNASNLSALQERVEIKFTKIDKLYEFADKVGELDDFGKTALSRLNLKRVATLPIPDGHDAVIYKTGIEEIGDVYKVKDASQVGYNDERLSYAIDLNNTDTKVKPILKWAGGKTQLLDVLNEHLPTQYNHYIEPFIGGGALFFNVQPKSATINDFNGELVKLYEVFKSDDTTYNKFVEELKKHERNHSSDYFYSIRNIDRDPGKMSKLNDYEIAARFVYLNKAGYRGIMRYNQKGQFNTPLGAVDGVSLPKDEDLLALRNYFLSNEVNILQGDYKKAISDAKKGDFVYLDPPYDYERAEDVYKYTAEGFGRKEQIELAKEVDKLTKNGVRVMISNHNTKLINELFAKYDKYVVSARRSLSRDRASVDEILITNYSLIGADALVDEADLRYSININDSGRNARMAALGVIDNILSKVVDAYSGENVDKIKSDFKDLRNVMMMIVDGTYNTTSQINSFTDELFTFADSANYVINKGLRKTLLEQLVIGEENKPKEKVKKTETKKAESVPVEEDLDWIVESDYFNSLNDMAIRLNTDIANFKDGTYITFDPNEMNNLLGKIRAEVNTVKNDDIKKQLLSAIASANAENVKIWMMIDPKNKGNTNVVKSTAQTAQTTINNLLKSIQDIISGKQADDDTPAVKLSDLKAPEVAKKTEEAKPKEEKPAKQAKPAKVLDRPAVLPVSLKGSKLGTKKVTLTDEERASQRSAESKYVKQGRGEYKGYVQFKPNGFVGGGWFVLKGMETDNRVASLLNTVENAFNSIYAYAPNRSLMQKLQRMSAEKAALVDWSKYGEGIKTNIDLYNKINDDLTTLKTNNNRIRSEVKYGSKDGAKKPAVFNKVEDIESFITRLDDALQASRTTAKNYTDLINNIFGKIDLELQSKTKAEENDKKLAEYTRKLKKIEEQATKASTKATKAIETKTNLVEEIADLRDLKKTQLAPKKKQALIAMTNVLQEKVDANTATDLDKYVLKLLTHAYETLGDAMDLTDSKGNSLLDTIENADSAERITNKIADILFKDLGPKNIITLYNNTLAHKGNVDNLRKAILTAIREDFDDGVYVAPLFEKALTIAKERARQKDREADLLTDTSNRLDNITRILRQELEEGKLTNLNLIITSKAIDNSLKRLDDKNSSWVLPLINEKINTIIDNFTSFENLYNINGGLTPTGYLVQKIILEIKTLYVKNGLELPKSLSQEVDKILPSYREVKVSEQKAAPVVAETKPVTSRVNKDGITVAIGGETVLAGHQFVKDLREAAKGSRYTFNDKVASLLAQFLSYTTDYRSSSIDYSENIDSVKYRANIYAGFFNTFDGVLSDLSYAEWEQLARALSVARDLDMLVHPNVLSNIINLLKYFSETYIITKPVSDKTTLDSKGIPVSSLEIEMARKRRIMSYLNTIVATMASQVAAPMGKLSHLGSYYDDYAHKGNIVLGFRSGLMDYLIKNRGLSKNDALSEVDSRVYAISLKAIIDAQSASKDGNNKPLVNIANELRNILRRSPIYRTVEKDGDVINEEEIDNAVAALLSGESVKMNMEDLQDMYDAARSLGEYGVAKYIDNIFQQEATKLVRNIGGVTDLIANLAKGKVTTDDVNNVVKYITNLTINADTKNKILDVIKSHKGNAINNQSMLTIIDSVTKDTSITPDTKKDILKTIGKITKLSKAESKEIYDQIGKRITAFRYMALLSNPSVYVKNVVMNFANTVVTVGAVDTLTKQIRDFLDGTSKLAKLLHYKGMAGKFKSKTGQNSAYLLNDNGDYVNYRYEDNKWKYRGNTRSDLVASYYSESDIEEIRKQEPGLNLHVKPIDVGNQLRISTGKLKSSDAAKAFVKKNLIDNDLLSLILLERSSGLSRGINTATFEKYVQSVVPFGDKTIGSRLLRKTHIAMYDALEGMDMKAIRSLTIRYVTEMVEANGLYTMEVGPNNIEAYMNIIEKYIQVAVLQSLDVVFKSDSALLRLFHNLQGKNPAARLITSAILPFARISFNIVKQMFDYSPFGLLKTVADIVRVNMSGYEVNREKIEDRFKLEGLSKSTAKGIIGTTFMALGFLLGSLGLIRIDEDKEYNGYVVYFGDDGVRVNITSLSTVAAPILLGASLSGFGREPFKETMSKAITQYVNMTFLGNLLDTARTYDLSTIPADLVEDYLVSYSPSILKSAVRLISNTEKQYAPGGWESTWLQRVFERSLPMFAQDRVDPYTGGKDYLMDRDYAFLINLWNMAGFAPVYLYEKSDEQRLMEGYGLVMSQSTNTKLTFTGTEIDITGEERRFYNIERGKAFSWLVKQAKNTSAWRKANSEERKKILEGLKTASSTFAKTKLWLDKSPSNYYQYTSNNVYASMMAKYYQDSRIRKVTDLKEKGENYYGSWL